MLGALGGTERRATCTAWSSHLSKAAAVLTATDGEIESVVDDLATVASTLADRAPELERSMATMPATLREARAGLTALDGTLARLQATAPGARPSVARLTELLRKLPPVLQKATPLLADLRPVVADLKPALDDLAPTAGLLRQLLGDLEDPVLGRLRDHVVPALLGPYTGHRAHDQGLRGAGLLPGRLRRSIQLRQQRRVAAQLLRRAERRLAQRRPAGQPTPLRRQPPGPMRRSVR